ncbi:MAG: GGDEF domain-containing protein [Campylobacterales bacterium]|nr:GGDEF domain-containing protein [Campylobacterales bacterium]
MEDKKVVEKLKKLTESTLKKVCRLDVITPSLYKDTFLSFAKECDIEIDFEDQEYNEYLIKQIKKFQKSITETSSSLKSNIKEALEAIREKDEKKLLQVEEKVYLLEAYIKSLEDDILKDELTNTYNRRWLYDRFLKENCFQENGVMSFVDINKFKAINDTHGHVIGDKVLILIASMLQSISHVHVIRFAGDEFIVIFRKQTLEEAKNIIKTLQDKLSHKAVHIKDSIFPMNFSSGIVEFKLGEIFNEVLEKADKLMYEEKNSA